ncbi:DUF1998 domain-containing protein [Mesorhizobium sp. B2-4-14]|uniref:DUF1998 domain-containing protein n=1 Tax=Mesorhizobium sp. B2-4-14 TaxID=2589935 RepID=UPI0015E39F6A|nr:DUF1998 domain-containing protein [Mesorhizobium sp. B2-4-14]
MPKPTIRSAQLISPFGIGSLCEIDGQSFFVRGTGSWAKGYNLEKIEVGSLTDWLRPRQLKQPTESVAILRFPHWHFCPECRKMIRWTQDKDRELVRDDGSLPRPTCDGAKCKNARLVPMRFVAACDNGHIDEIDWYWWAHRGHEPAQHGACSRATSRLHFEVTGKSGGDFSSMIIRCSCGAMGNLEGIADGPLPQKCRGYQPGEPASTCVDLENKKNPGAPKPLYMEPRGSSSLHYASVISALDIDGDTEKDAWEKLRADAIYQSTLQMASSLVRLQGGDTSLAIQSSRANLETRAEEVGISLEDALACFEADLGASPVVASPSPPRAEISQQGILAQEFPVLANPKGQNSRWLIARPAKPTARFALDQLFERFVRVERLREVRAFRGFQRRNVSEKHAMITPSLGRQQPDWLPAMMVLGEGVFLEFSNSALAAWRLENAEAIEEFTHSHLVSAEALGLPDRMGFNANPTFIMVHSFAHLLLNQLSFDCGYSSTSLRERIYCGTDSQPYAGLLIYTADSDAEGSMGGLSEMGTPERLEDVIYRAVSRSQWCSGDPVCRELDAQGVDGLNRAACHACSLVAETSCTFSNVLLDRVLVSSDGRTNGRGRREPVGYFNKVLEL